VAAAGAVILAAIAMPWLVSGNFWLHLGVMIFINAIMALSVNVVLKTGQVSLAQAAFMGLGAYASAHFTQTFGLPFAVGFILSGLLAALVAALLGVFILRLKGVYFILFSFALCEFSFLVAKDLEAVTGGNTGMVGIPAATLPFIDVSFRSTGNFYYLALAICVLVFAGMWMVYRSPLGRAMDAVRESELLAGATGYDPMRVKVIAFGLGALIAGFGGSLIAHFLRYIAPFNFTFWDSVNFLIMNIIGGSLSLIGPLIGAALLTPLPELLRGQVVWQQFLYGLILIVFMRFLPDGVTSVVRTLGRRLAEYRGTSPTNPSRKDIDEARR
jgi:branched-chain amino acid transport system permease protein